ncbi:hypothetical protein BGZ83_005968 [Gryganskiella cystojenkinii]|nr:hypothetical protein BGZ83_005968 [Gryganskiella cystojenkinii]
MTSQIDRLQRLLRDTNKAEYGMGCLQVGSLPALPQRRHCNPLLQMTLYDVVMLAVEDIKNPERLLTQPQAVRAPPSSTSPTAPLQSPLSVASTGRQRWELPQDNSGGLQVRPIGVTISLPFNAKDYIDVNGTPRPTHLRSAAMRSFIHVTETDLMLYLKGKLPITARDEASAGLVIETNEITTQSSAEMEEVAIELEDMGGLERPANIADTPSSAGSVE